MPGITLPNTGSSVVGSTIARTERIERNTGTVAPRDPVIQYFTFPGVLLDHTESPPWYVPRSGVVELIRMSFTSALVGTNTVSFRVNGIEQQQLTMVMGETSHVFNVTIGVGFGQYVTLSTLDVSGSDTNMSVELRIT